MELLQKLTLYDLFGYTLPGVLAVWWCGYDGELWQMNDVSLGSLCILVILGYVAGTMITELAERIEWGLLKLIPESGKDKYWQDICRMYGITTDMVKHALDKAKIADYAQNANASMLVRQYYTYIYSEIQTDAKYGRLHNYSSAELLYKNMFLVSLLVIHRGLIVHQQSIEIVIGVIGAVSFAIRRVRFAERSRGYAICWFVQKYGKNA